MDKKIISVLIVSLLISTGIVILPENIIVKANPGDPGEDENSLIDLQLIYKVTENLSRIIFDSYGEGSGEIAKGRAFGTPGEHDAKDYLHLKMNEILGADNVTIETLQGRTGLYETDYIKEVDDHLEVKEKGLLLNGVTPVDCYISPTWNNTLKDKRLDNDYDINNLTHNFSYLSEDVRIYKMPPIWWLDFVIINNIIDILTKIIDGVITTLISLLSYVLELLEDEYDFDADEIDPENIPLGMMDPYDFERETKGDPGLPYVYIHEDPAFNPNVSTTFITTVLESLRDRLPGANPFIGFMSEGWRHLRKILPMWKWYNWNPNCKGLILYDHHKDTYNQESRFLGHLPTIFINKSIGKPLYDDARYIFPATDKIRFWINQQWNDGVVSYNVIGEIEGTNTEETAIIGVLYDSWWNQGTADSAIAVGMMLAIAKYMKELETYYNIIPKCNVKFIAFSGEEQGMRGAYDYEAAHRDENITTFIDLNQLGFTHPEPRLIMNIVYTNPDLTEIIDLIGDDNNYVQRTGNVADFRTVPYKDWPYISDYKPFYENRTDDEDLPTPNCFSLVKDLAWKFHHRDGLEHTAGDTLDYYNETDVNVTVDLLWNLTKLYTIDPFCWFDHETSVTYEAVDSSNDEDENNDGIQATMTINTSLPKDMVMIKAILKDAAYGLSKLTKTQSFVISPGDSEISMTVTLPPTADSGNYYLELELYNSTGRIKEKTKTWYDNSDYYNDTDIQSGSYSLQPRGNRAPNKPTLDGPDQATIFTGIPYDFTATATDPNGDLVAYQFDWNVLYPRQKPRFYPKTYESGETCIRSKTYAIPGDKVVMVRSVDNYGAMSDWTIISWGDWGDEWSEWSDPLEFTVQLSLSFDISANPQTSSNSLIAVAGESVMYYGRTFGGTGTYNWTWNFEGETRGLPAQKYFDQNANHTYNQIGEYDVSLNVTDENGYPTNISTVINVVNLKADFNRSINSSVEPFETIYFNDSSIGVNAISNWTWNFGDEDIPYLHSNMSFEQYTNHTFNNTGEYNVTLTVRDNESNIRASQISPYRLKV